MAKANDWIDDLLDPLDWGFDGPSYWDIKDIVRAARAMGLRDAARILFENNYSDECVDIIEDVAKKVERGEEPKNAPRAG